MIGEMATSSDGAQVVNDIHKIAMSALLNSRPAHFALTQTYPSFEVEAM